MATNPPIGDGHRQGAVRKRSQVYNPKTKRWEKRDAKTGRIMDVKSDKKPFKGVRKEKPKHHEDEHAQVAQESSEHAEVEEHTEELVAQESSEHAEEHAEERAEQEDSEQEQEPGQRQE